MRAFVAVLAAGSLVACSNSPPPINQDNPCIDGPPNDEPSACPSPEPSYQTDVLPVLESSCLLCHTPTFSDGGIYDGGCFADGGYDGGNDGGYCVVVGPSYLNPQYSSPYDFSTYALQSKNKGTILTQLLKCNMPNVDAGAMPLDEAQRLILMDWIVCGTPDN
jgi:hypothetical protein